MAQIRRLAPGSDLNAVRECMKGLRSLLYEKGVPLDDFQDFERELAELPGLYGEDAGGCILVASVVADELRAGKEKGTKRLRYATCLEPVVVPPTRLIADDGERPVAGERAVDESDSADTLDVLLGCVALKDISSYEGIREHLRASTGAAEDASALRICEMKRLFVPPAGRKFGAGRALCEALLLSAARLGFDVMVLDTLDRLPEACSLYESLGFMRTGRYVHNPMPDVRFYGKKLR